MPSTPVIRVRQIGEHTVQVVQWPNGRCQIAGREHVFRTLRHLERAVKGRSGGRNGRGGNLRSIRHHQPHGRAR